MTLKSDVKLEEESMCHCKNGMSNLVSFHPSTRKSQNLQFVRVLISKVYIYIYKALAKKLQSS